MEVSFITSYLTFYLKACEVTIILNISCPKHHSEAHSPALNKTFPWSRSPRSNSNFKVTLGCCCGGVLITYGLGSEPSLLLALIFTAVGVLMVLGSLQTAVYITRGRQRLPDPHYFPEKDKAEQICSGIQAMIANRYSDTNVRVHTEKSTDRLVDAINSMSRKVTDLYKARAAGHSSAAQAFLFPPAASGTKILKTSERVKPIASVLALRIRIQNGRSIPMKRWIKRISALALSAVLLAERPRFPPERRQGGFRDVSETAYYADAVGVGGGAWRHRRHLGHHFLPRGHRHRGQAVTFLWAAAGWPEPSPAPPFEDDQPRPFTTSPCSGRWKTASLPE